MLIINQSSNYKLPLRPEDTEIFEERNRAEIAAYIANTLNHAPTSLYELTNLAKKTKVRSVHVKDESTRFGLGSFKALGGSYAVFRLLLDEAAKRLNRKVEPNELKSNEVRRISQTITVACATDGNHGRSVAYGAQIFGANAVIFVHQGVSAKRLESISKHGAKIQVVAGTYDDSVIEAESQCKEKGWILVSDTSWPGYEQIPKLVMQGYTTMVKEILHDIVEPPTHVFLQAGVGGMAAAVAGELYARLRDKCPKVIVVEPSRAACLFETAKQNLLTKVTAQEPTIMAMLECYQPSLVAWRILSRRADAFLTIEDNDTVSVMKLLGNPLGNDQPIISGESGGAGLAGFMSVIDNSESCALLEINRNSRILAINTEGATDTDIYEKLTKKIVNEIV